MGSFRESFGESYNEPGEQSGVLMRVLGESYDVLGGAVEFVSEFSGNIIRSSSEEFWGVTFDNSPKLSKGSNLFLSVGQSGRRPGGGD